MDNNCPCDEMRPKLTELRFKEFSRGTGLPSYSEAIIPEQLWDKVQERLRGNCKTRRPGRNAKSPSLLVGLLFAVSAGTASLLKGDAVRLHPHSQKSPYP